MGSTINFVFQDAARRGAAALQQAGTLAARKWFREQARAVRYVNANRLMTSAPQRLISGPTSQDIGKMMLFFYDPKLKAKLPYYDMYPMIFVIDVTPHHMLGINLHYLHPLLRARLMDALYTTITDDRYDDKTRLRISYRILASATKYRWFKPCVKMYLWNHVRSKFFHVEPTDWDTVLMLPLERFQKATRTRVWLESAAKVR